MNSPVASFTANAAAISTADSGWANGPGTIVGRHGPPTHALDGSVAVGWSVAMTVDSLILPGTGPEESQRVLPTRVISSPGRSDSRQGLGWLGSGPGQEGAVPVARALRPGGPDRRLPEPR